jgi:hypothetical protein
MFTCNSSTNVLFGSGSINCDGFTWQSACELGHGQGSIWMDDYENIPGTVVRTSTIPEELGRLVYLLTDKTGTTHKCASFE